MKTKYRKNRFQQIYIKSILSPRYRVKDKLLILLNKYLHTKNLTLIGVAALLLGFLIMILASINYADITNKSSTVYALTSQLLLIIGFLILPYNSSKKENLLFFLSIYPLLYLVSFAGTLKYITAIILQEQLYIRLHIVLVILSMIFLVITFKLILFLKKKIQKALISIGQKQPKIHAFVTTIAALLAAVTTLINLFPLLQKMILKQG